jgi:purine-cytosine permease-like protein
MTHKYAPICAYILFHKTFLTFERFFVIWLSKYVFIFLLDFFIVKSSLDNFLLEDLKNTEETFLNFVSLKVSYL